MLPAAHGTHAERPAEAATEPAAQGEQLVEPAKVLTEPIAQFTHVAGLDAPTVEDAEPALHAMQTAADVALAPELVEYVPATQLVHEVAPTAAHVPAGQATQVELAPAPRAAEAKPAAQGVHVAAELAPVADEKVPAPHCVHEELPADAEYVPTPQLRHAAGAFAPALALKVPAAHGTQVAADAAPMAVEYVPGGQRVQDAEPEVAE
jgi:hypothetical protein